MLTPRENPLYWRHRRWLNPRYCITQLSEPTRFVVTWGGCTVECVWEAISGSPALQMDALPPGHGGVRTSEYLCALLLSYASNLLVGLVVKASTSRAEDLGLKSHLRWEFSGLSHTSDSKIGTPVATLPSAWRYRVSTGTGRPGVSIL